MRNVNKCPTCGGLLLFGFDCDSDFEKEVHRWIEFIELEGRSYSYIRNLRQRVRDYILAYFKGFSIRDIKTYHVHAFYQHLLKIKRLASKTVKHVLDTLRAFLYFEHQLDGIETLPRFPKFKITPKRQKAWIDLETQGRIISFIPERFRLLFFILQETGIRPGEACGLKKKDVREGGIFVERAIDERGIEKSTKTGKSYFRPVSGATMTAILDASKLFLPEKYLFSHSGQVCTSKYLYNIWRRACNKAKINISLYNAMRHSLVSQKRKELEASMHETLRKELCHTSATTTMKHYALTASQEVGFDR